MRHLLSGGYDSHVSVAPLAPSSSSSSRHNPVWTTATDGLVQAVSWINSPESQGDSGNLFAWGTSGKVLAVGDLRVDKPVMTVQTDAMINSLQSFRRSPHLLVGDSAGQIRHFSLRTGSFVAPAEAAAAAMLPPPFPPPSSSSSATTTTSSTPPTKKATPISCLALNGDWKGKREARWVASIGFDNFVRVYDRGMDPLRSSPKLVQTLKGKNRNWPIKAAWYQGRDCLHGRSNDLSPYRRLSHALPLGFLHLLLRASTPFFILLQHPTRLFLRFRHQHLQQHLFQLQDEILAGQRPRSSSPVVFAPPRGGK
ncbi:hypothetical protein RQP46_002721 [Phenoliferia psychrophenolica]